MLSIIVGFSAASLLNNQFNIIKHINEFIKVLTRNKVRNSILKFFDTKYSKELASFAKLLLFNIKSKETYTFYNQIVNLGVVWLFCISGFHISLISKIIKRIFKNHQRIALSINLVWISFYMVLLKIPYGCLRIFLTLFFTHLFKKIRLNGFDKLGFVGLCICMLNVNCFASYGFLLSFTVCMSAIYLKKFEIGNKLINSLLASLLFYLVTIPFMFDMSNKVSIFTFINTFIFNYLLTGYFLYLNVFIWIPIMQPVHTFLMHGMYMLIGNISFTNIFIYSDKWPVWVKFLYYLAYIFIYRISYLIVKHNKI